MDASVPEPSTRHAVSTFLLPIAVPLAVFALATFAMFKAGITQPAWVPMLVVYALGTAPGLVLGVRYPASAKAKWTFGIAYLLVCAGILVAVLLVVGCWLTNVCL